MDRSKEARQARKLERSRKAGNSVATNYKARKSRDRFNTWLIISGVALVGMGLVGLQVYQERNATDTPSDHASMTPTPAPVSTEVVPENPDAKAGEATPFSEPAKVSDTPIACGAAQPENAAAVRNTYPGGPGEVDLNADLVAEINTSCGPIVVDLLEKEAPKTVNSFAFLGQQQFFDGLEIFRNATTIGALQTGSGTNDATWKIGYNLPDELDVANQGYFTGDVAMANAGPNTGGSQFFFVYNDKFQLPPQYATFGRVIKGQDVLTLIGGIKASGESGETPEERVYMNNVVIRPATEEEQAASKAKAEENAKAAPAAAAEQPAAEASAEAPADDQAEKPADAEAPKAEAAPSNS